MMIVVAQQNAAIVCSHQKVHIRHRPKRACGDHNDFHTQPLRQFYERVVVGVLVLLHAAQ